jgi:hypothetical protein
MHYRKYRIALIFVSAMIIGSAANLWYIWVSAFLNDELTVEFSINRFHEMGIEFFMACLFFFLIGWLILRRKQLMQLLKFIDKEELRKRSWWE